MNVTMLSKAKGVVKNVTHNLRDSEHNTEGTISQFLCNTVSIWQDDERAILGTKMAGEGGLSP
jgi:hypothetical protein